MKINDMQSILWDDIICYFDGFSCLEKAYKTMQTFERDERELEREREHYNTGSRYKSQGQSNKQLFVRFTLIHYVGLDAIYYTVRQWKYTRVTT